MIRGDDAVSLLYQRPPRRGRERWMKLVLANWVKLEVGKEVKLHFREYVVRSREIEDPDFKVMRKVETLLFLVDRMDGEEVDKTFSVLSEKLAQEFEPYLEDGSFRNYEWVLVKDGPGYVAPRIARRLRV